MGYSERRTTPFLEFYSTSAGIERLPKNWLKKSAQLSLLMTLVISSASAATVAPSRRGKMKFTTGQQQEFKDSVTQSTYESTAYSSYDLTDAVVTGHVRSKKLKDSSQDTLAEETRETACKRLSEPQNDTDDHLSEDAEAHSDRVDDYCESEAMSDCHPVRTVLHVSRMCIALPAAIQNLDRMKTVVMRCPSLPCCKVDFLCKAKSSVEFQVTFKAIYQDMTKFLTIPVRNDTECECRKHPTKCPKPFWPSKGGCKCYQKSKSLQKQCEEIKGGRRPLVGEEKRCVAENNCGIPVCSSKLRYDTRTGYCITACMV